MTSAALTNKIDTAFLKAVDPDGKLNLASCLQCGRCSSGCTMRQEIDVLPHQLNRLVVLGLKDRVMNSRTVWACASCQTCVSRCPMKVDTPALIDRLREMSEQKAPEDLEKVRLFNSAMLASVRRFGRVYEFGMMGVYKMRTRDFFSDVAKLPMMLRKGKMRLLPPRVAGRRDVATIFDRARRQRRSRQ